MKTLHTPGWRAALAIPLAAAALLAACSDATAPRQDDGLPGNLDRGIYPLINVVSQTASAAQVDLYLKRVPSAVKLASFQGELTYDATVMTLDHTDLPAGIIGSTNEVGVGHVRFAGAALDGVGDVPVLTLRFTRHGEVQRESFKVKVEEVSGTEGFADLTAQVSGRDPYFHMASGH
ncbi:MAG: hypothetical protein JWM27_2879 [Gemmatimonadetes bacterium]|nr:hypothetical protein [Gemmatimonadota bacterium]